MVPHIDIGELPFQEKKYVEELYTKNKEKQHHVRAARLQL
jgi:hypothetical protein